MVRQAKKNMQRASSKLGKWKHRRESHPSSEVSKLLILRKVKLCTKLLLHPAPILTALREAVTM